MGELKLINLEDVQIEEIEWLWKPYIPKGKATLVRGMPGEGKTMVLATLVAALTNGDPLFNEESRHKPISCVYQSAEDGLGDTIKPRLESGDAVQRKVWAINEDQDPLSFTDTRIVRWYDDYLTTAEAKTNIAEFDHLLPEYAWVSETKKIDCLLWSKRG